MFKALIKLQRVGEGIARPSAVKCNFNLIQTYTYLPNKLFQIKQFSTSANDESESKNEREKQSKHENQSSKQMLWNKQRQNTQQSQRTGFMGKKDDKIQQQKGQQEKKPSQQSSFSLFGAKEEKQDKIKQQTPEKSLEEAKKESEIGDPTFEDLLKEYGQTKNEPLQFQDSEKMFEFLEKLDENQSQRKEIEDLITRQVEKNVILDPFIDFSGIQEKYGQKGYLSVEELKSFLDDIEKSPRISSEDLLMMPQERQENEQEEEDQNTAQRMNLKLTKHQSFFYSLDKTYEYIQETLGKQNEGQLVYKRDKFEMNYVRTLKLFLEDQQRQGVKSIDYKILRDLNSQSKIFIEKIGSQEFHTHMKTVFNKLQLENNQIFSSLITDMLFNQLEITQDSRIRCQALDRFIILILQLENPKFYLQFKEIQSQFLKDLEVNYLQTEQDKENYGKKIFNLIEDPNYMLLQNFLFLAKNFNQVGQLDRYMKTLGKLLLQQKDSYACSRLQDVLNKEIAIIQHSEESIIDQRDILTYKDYEHPIHHNVLAQPDFQFLPLQQKVERIKNYQQLKNDYLKNQQIRDLLKSLSETDWQKNDEKRNLIQRKLLDNSEGLFQILSQLDNTEEQQKTTLPGQLDDLAMSNGGVGVIERFKKTHIAANELASKVFQEKFDIYGINLENAEQIFNPLVSGKGSMSSLRSDLIKKGMQENTVDYLAKSYISKIEQNKTTYFCTFMDLFNSIGSKKGEESLKKLQETSIQNVILNYQTYSEYEFDRHKQQQDQQLRQQSQRHHSYQTISNYQPVRPINYIRSEVRGFSTSNKIHKEQQKEYLYSQEYQEKKQAKGKFFEFIKQIDQIDQTQKQKEESFESQKFAGENEVEGVLEQPNYDISEFDIDFEKVIKVELPKINKGDLKDQHKEEERLGSKEKGSELIAVGATQYSVEQQNQIREAQKKFNKDFFKNFAFSGPDQQVLVQKSLEDYIVSNQDRDDISNLIISMTTQSYQLNALIPNIQLIFYKMFCSPLCTKEQRQRNLKEGDILKGNIFLEKGVQLTYFGYKSLLETLLLYPKKKHLKKIIEYVQRVENKKNLDPEIITLIIQNGIDHKYPVLLGRTLKFFIQNGFKIQPSAFQQFIYFLESCKGFEEDAKKFLGLISETENIEFNYKLIRPIFQRLILYKSGNELLKDFEQIRKIIQLNRNEQRASQTQQSKNELILAKRADFYRGLSKDLVDAKNLDLALIIQNEMVKDNIQFNLQDLLLSLKILSQQKDVNTFKNIVEQLIALPAQDGQNDQKGSIYQQIFSEIGINIQQFNDESFTLDNQMRQKLKESIEKFEQKFFKPQGNQQQIVNKTQNQQELVLKREVEEVENENEEELDEKQQKKEAKLKRKQDKKEEKELEKKQKEHKRLLMKH